MGTHAFELLTPRGFGGVAVVSVVGGERAAAAATLVGRPAVEAAASGKPRLATLRCLGEALDQALVVVRDAAIELHVHGSEAVLATLEDAVGGFVSRSPSRGDLLLRQARSAGQLELALEQRGRDFEAELATTVAAGREALAALHARSIVSMALAVPQRLVLCGAQNAGKSTLMNRLLFRERVLTGDQPGLTRDAVAEDVELAGYPYLLIDTAGEGEVAPGLDEQALRRARDARREGIRLLVVDGHRGPSIEDRAMRTAETLVVRSKADLELVDWPREFPADVTVAGREPAAAPRVRQDLGAALLTFRRLPPAGPVGGVAALDGEEWAAVQAAVQAPA